MLKTLLRGLMQNKSRDDEQAKIENLSKHEQARVLVEQVAIKIDNRMPFNPVRASGVYLQCVNTDVLGFTERINEYANRLELGDGLTPKDCYAEVKEVTLDRFFTDSEGMYIPLEEFDNFVTGCRRLFSAMERGQERGIQGIEYSIRLMGKCFTSIQNVCKAVETASH
jgi:hypothetical protein